MKTKTCQDCIHGGAKNSSNDVLCKIMWFVVSAEVAACCASFDPRVELPAESAQNPEK